MQCVHGVPGERERERERERAFIAIRAGHTYSVTSVEGTKINDSLFRCRDHCMSTTSSQYQSNNYNVPNEYGQYQDNDDYNSSTNNACCIDTLKCVICSSHGGGWLSS